MHFERDVNKGYYKYLHMVGKKEIGVLTAEKKSTTYFWHLKQ